MILCHVIDSNQTVSHMWNASTIVEYIADIDIDVNQCSRFSHNILSTDNEIPCGVFCGVNLLLVLVCDLISTVITSFVATSRSLQPSASGGRPLSVRLPSVSVYAANPSRPVPNRWPTDSHVMPGHQGFSYAQRNRRKPAPIAAKTSVQPRFHSAQSGELPLSVLFRRKSGAV